MTKPDNNTGFPEVPEGYFWQVTHSALPGMFRVELRKKLFWIFSQRIEFTITAPPLSRALLFEEAEYVLEKWRESKHYIAIEETSSMYVGKYPPKNLKDAPK